MLDKLNNNHYKYIRQVKNSIIKLHKLNNNDYKYVKYVLKYSI